MAKTKINGTGFKVEKGVSRPPANIKNTYPFAEMALSDSFFVPCKARDEKRIRHQIYEYSSRWARRDPTTMSHKFSTRKVDGGLRVWRTA